jgi:radical SAM superfamily enzyme YgiQ (UPF0313 family)
MIIHANTLNISICADFIFGLEHEDEYAINETIKYALSLPLDFASFNIAAPLPGSSIRQSALADGRIKINIEVFDTLGKNGVLATSKLDSKILIKLRNSAVKKFYLRPSYIYRRLKKTTSFQHFFNQLNQAFHLFLKSY